MTFKLVAVFAVLAVANAGYLNAPVAHYSPAAAVSTSYISQPAIHAAPVSYNAAPVAYNVAPVAAYQHAPVAVHAPAVGATHQSVLRSLGGNQAVSHYSKAVDSAFSTVRKYDTRITNDALSVAHTPVIAHAAPYATPYVSHASPLAYAAQAPLVAKAAVAYSPAAVVSHTTFEGLGTHYAW